MFTQLIWAGWGAATIGSFVLASSFGVMGAVTNNSTLMHLAELSYTPEWMALWGTVVIVLIGILLLTGTRSIFRVQNVLVIIMLFGIMMIFGLLATATPTQFQAAFDSFMGRSGAYQDVLAAAQEAGLTFAPNSLYSMWMSMSVVAMWIGFNFINVYTSGEVKDVTRTQFVSMVGGGITVATLFAVGVWLLFRIAGTEFITSLAYLSYVNPEAAAPATHYPYYNFFVSLVTTNPLLLALIALTMSLSGYLSIHPLIVSPSRVFFAWSFDRIFPERMTKVNRKGVPVTVTLFSLIVAEIFVIVFSYTPLITVMSVTYCLFSGSIIAAYGAAFIPFVSKGKEHYWKSPYSKYHPLVPVCGLVYGTATLLSIVPVAINPWYASNQPIHFLFNFVYGIPIPIAIYLIAKTYYKRKGIPFEAAFKEIPPA
jgi:amino acid transporter